MLVYSKSVRSTTYTTNISTEKKNLGYKRHGRIYYSVQSRYFKEENTAGTIITYNSSPQRITFDPDVGRQRSSYP